MHFFAHWVPKIAWLLFWLLAFLSLLIVLLFAYAVFPVLAALAQGIYVGFWFAGNTGFILLVAALYLAVAIVVFAKRRAQGARRRPDR